MGIFNKLFSRSGNVIGAPVAGECVPLSQVNDPTFSHEILGKGVAIIPQAGAVYAPCDAVVDVLFTTGHAVSLLTDFGAEILIHIGLETVNLQGRYFRVMVEQGQRVVKGQRLVLFDLEEVAAAGYDTIVPVVVCNSDKFAELSAITGKQVTPGQPVLRLGRKAE